MFNPGWYQQLAICERITMHPGSSARKARFPPRAICFVRPSLAFRPWSHNSEKMR
uniref:Uncharacterized protein n=1 Tax=Arundo donax TaxID=35708 RepID=A0A0A9GFC1_ARUDO